MKEQLQRILKTASKRFSKYGYKKTSIEEIAGDLRMVKSSLYHYFRSKNELYFETINYEINNYIDRLKSELSSVEKKEEFPSKYFGIKNKFFEEYPLFKELFDDWKEEELKLIVNKLAKKIAQKEIEALEEYFENCKMEKRKSKKLAALSYSLSLWILISLNYNLTGVLEEAILTEILNEHLIY